MDQSFANVAPHLRHLLQDMLQHLEIKDRRYFGRLYRTCFKGKTAVKFMLNGRHANDILHAEDLGNELMSAGVLEHVCQSHSFKNKSLYYRFSIRRDNFLRVPATRARHIHGLHVVSLRELVCRSWAHKQCWAQKVFLSTFE